MSKRTWLIAVLVSLATVPAAAQEYSEWSEPVNLGCVVNSARSDGHPYLSKNGLRLYFYSGRTKDIDLYVSEREGIGAPWGAPKSLGATLNSVGGSDFAPALSPDEHTLYFSSQRSGGLGATDLYVSRRHNKRDDLGWQPPVNLTALNSAELDTFPWIFEDEVSGNITLYFESKRAGGLGGTDIWASSLLPDESFGAPLPVEELNTAFDDGAPAVARDGLSMYFVSTRPGSLGERDIWMATRASTADPWSSPTLVPAVNTVYMENRPAISADGTELYFISTRPGFCLEAGTPVHVQDIWVSTRTKLPDGE